MPKLTSPFRIVSIILLFLIGINAVIAGVLFIMDPSGSKMGMSVDYLSPSPFQSYLIPGIELLVFNGLLGIVSGVMSIKRVKNYSNLILLQGVILVGWILIQILMVRDINLLHV